MPAPTSIGLDRETKELLSRLAKRLNAHQSRVVRCGLKLVEILLSDPNGRLIVLSLLHGEPVSNIQELSIRLVLELLQKVEKGLEEVNRRLTRIENRLEALEKIRPMLGEAGREEKPRPPIAVIEELSASSDLPSWMRDNPWISIIASRSSGEER